MFFFSRLWKGSVFAAEKNADGNLFSMVEASSRNTNCFSAEIIFNLTSGACTITPFTLAH